MIPPIYVDAIIHSSVLTLLSIGLTLTYLTTKVPNFAHGTFAMVGAYITLTVSMVWKGVIYHHLYLAFLVGGITALVQYILVLKPLTRRGVSIVGLMIATLAIDMVLITVLNIYADYVNTQFKVLSRYFLLAACDVPIAGVRGLFIVAPTLVAVAVILLYLTLTRTKFGVAMRAAIENPSLASVVGINVSLVYAISWFIAGGLAGLSGGLLPLYSQCNPDGGTILIASVFAASIVGGLLHIYGAVLGGYLIGLLEILATYYLSFQTGPWIMPYKPLIPLIAIAVTLLLAPQGLTGVNWRGIVGSLRKSIARIRTK